MTSWDDSEAFEAALPLSQRALGARAQSSGPAPYLDDLNPAQRAAVEALDGPVLMLAGAGTGKTKALTSRIVHLLRMGRARPNEILAVTFTNKAAREMKDRVHRLLGEVAEGMPWMGTFHSLSVKILRRHAELVGLKSNFTILDTDDQLRLLKQLIAAANIDEKRWPARMMAGISCFSRRNWSSVSRMVKLDASPTWSACRRSIRAHRAWKVPSHRPSAGSPRRVATRSRISRAALLVKVTARTWLGKARLVSRMWANRVVSTRVLPVPAPASTNSGPSTVSTAARCSAFRRVR